MNVGPAVASGNEVYYHADYPVIKPRADKISKTLEKSM